MTGNAPRKYVRDSGFCARADIFLLLDLILLFLHASLHEWFKRIHKVGYELDCFSRVFLLLIMNIQVVREGFESCSIECLYSELLVCRFT